MQDAIPYRNSLHGKTGSRRPAGRGSLLIADPDAEVRRSASRILTLHGYLVFEAADGHEAFLLSETTAHPLHMLIIDVVLQADLSGFDLARHLQVLRPNLRVLYLSGVPHDEAARRDLDETQDLFLGKPFTPDRLRGKVDLLMGRPAPARRPGRAFRSSAQRL